MKDKDIRHVHYDGLSIAIEHQGAIELVQLGDVLLICRADDRSRVTRVGVVDWDTAPPPTAKDLRFIPLVDDRGFASYLASVVGYGGIGRGNK